MYNLIAAYVPTGHPTDLRTPIDTQNVLMDTLIRAHKRVDVLVTIGTSPALYRWQLDRTYLGSINPYATLDDYLRSLGDTNSLPVTAVSSYAYASYLRFSDAFQAGYQATPCAPGQSPDLVLPPAEMTDVILTKTGIDYGLFGQSCLVSVNGFFHYSQAYSLNSNQGIYVVDGGKNRNRVQHNQIGIHSFADLGTIQQIPITASMIQPQGNGFSLVDGAFLNLGVDISQSIPLLVIGGYLHVMNDRVYKAAGKETLRVDFANYPIFDRYYESRQAVDPTSLGLDVSPINPTQVGVSQMLSDAVITRLLTLSNSFVVLLSKGAYFKYRMEVHHNQLLDSYTSFIDPRYPLVNGFGRVSEYWSSLEQDRWGLKTIPLKYPSQIYNTLSLYSQTSLSDNQDPYTPGDVSPAYFLMLGKQNTLVPATP